MGKFPNPHRMRTNDNLNMQEHFVFVDTETERFEIDDETEKQKLKMGVGKYWNRKTDGKDSIVFWNNRKFWEWLMEVLGDKDQLIVFAHNMDFDFKILQSLEFLIEKGFSLKTFWVAGGVFSLTFSRPHDDGEQELKFWDTGNYMRGSLEEIGDTIGLDKLDVDFEDVEDDELVEYCKRDVDIIYLLIRYLIDFLQQHDLTKLKPTAASLAMNIYRHRFLPGLDEDILIHDWTEAQRLESASYRGGLTDVFRWGEYDEKLFKLDINSMYPSVMIDTPVPKELEYYSHDAESGQKELRHIMNDRIDSPRKDCIAYVKIHLDKEDAWILTRADVDKQQKCIRLAGEFWIALPTPELEFVRKHGEILQISQLAAYDSAVLFEDYVNYFYGKRFEFRDEGNDLFEGFCKMLLNSLYGKFGQRQYDLVKEGERDEVDFQRIKLRGEIDKDLMQIGRELYDIQRGRLPSYSSFIAVASTIASRARMLLVDLIKKAGTENVFYTDTDSLVVNREGKENLKDIIGDDLGELDLEEEAEYGAFWRPKFYDFGEERKAKGVKSSADLVEETGAKAVYSQEQWSRLKGSLNSGDVDCQVVENQVKELSKVYDSGLVGEDGRTEPFTVHQNT